MAIIDNIVSVNISRETTAVEMASFDIPLILVDTNADLANMLNGIVFTYTGLEGVANDFGVEHKAYRIAEKLFGGDLRPSTFKVGIKNFSDSYAKALADIIEVDNNWYALLSDADLPADILSLASAIQAQRKMYFTSINDALALDRNQTVSYEARITLPNNVGDSEDNSKITLNINGSIYTMAKDGGAWGALVNINDSASFPGTATINGTSLELVSSSTMFTVNSGVASLEIEDSGTSAIETIITQLEGQALGDTEITGMDIGQQLSLKGYNRTAIMYSSTAWVDWPEAVWVGGQLPEIPGSNTWEYKQLPGVMVDHLTDNEVNLLESRGYNYYIPVKGVNITRRGKTAGGVWVD